MHYKTTTAFLKIIGLLLVCGSARCQVSDSSYFFVRYQHTVLFDTDKHGVDTIPSTVLNVLKRLCIKHPNDQILLEGRADHRGSVLYNHNLAARRVESVQSYLFNRDLESQNISKTIYGELNAIADNLTPDGMQANRSVRMLLGQYHPAEFITGQITDSSGLGIQTNLFIGNKYQFRELRTDNTGFFTAAVPKDGLISIESFGCKYVLSKRYINMAKAGNDLGDLVSELIKVGMSFDFDDILFVGNKDIILPEYVPFLDALVSRIRAASCVSFEIQGHVNQPNAPPRDTTSWEYDLSQRRALKIYNYLVQNGIDSKRLTHNGYSNWFMLYPNARSEAQQQLNRRVTIEVTGFLY